jgi:hypothetical protein
MGPMKLSDEAMQWFENWYNTIENEMIPDHNMIGFVERKPDTVLKLSIILAAAVTTKIITLEILKQAYDIVTWTQSRAFEAFKHIDMSPSGRLRNDLKIFIESQGGEVTRTQILRKFNGRLPNGVSDLNSAQELMVEAGILNVEITPNKRGKQTVVYRLAGVEYDD